MTNTARYQIQDMTEAVNDAGQRLPSPWIIVDTQLPRQLNTGEWVGSCLVSRYPSERTARFAVSELNRLNRISQ